MRDPPRQGLSTVVDGRLTLDVHKHGVLRIRAPGVLRAELDGGDAPMTADGGDGSRTVLVGVRPVHAQLTLHYASDYLAGCPCSRRCKFRQRWGNGSWWSEEETVMSGKTPTECWSDEMCRSSVESWTEHIIMTPQVFIDDQLHLS